MTDGSTVVVAGTAGGVGTTTVAALLFAAFGTIEGPRLSDHSGGELGGRLPGGDDVLALSPEVALHDAGPHAFSAGLDRLAAPRDILLVVTPATPHGLAEAERALGEVRDRYGAAGLSRTVAVPVGVFGRHRLSRQIESLLESFGRRAVTTVPRDRALAAGGRIPANRLAAETRRAQRDLLANVRHRVAAHRG